MLWNTCIIRNTIVILCLTPFRLQNCPNCGIDSTRCWKHCLEMLAHIDRTASCSWWRFVGCTSRARSSHSTTSVYNIDTVLPLGMFDFLSLTIYRFDSTSLVVCANLSSGSLKSYLASGTSWCAHSHTQHLKPCKTSAVFHGTRCLSDLHKHVKCEMNINTLTSLDQKFTLNARKYRLVLKFY